MSTTAVKPRYRSPSVSVYAQCSLDEFSDDEIRKEYEHRAGLVNHTGADGECVEPVPVEASELRRIRMLLLCNQTESAVRAMQELVRDALGTAL